MNDSFQLIISKYVQESLHQIETCKLSADVFGVMI